MALFEKEVRVGLRRGTSWDVCDRCNNGESLEGQEIFTIVIRGLEYNLCMKHLKDLLYGKVLVNKSDVIENDEYVKVPIKLINEGTTDEVIKYIESVVK